jgi:hypothetical protein
MTRIQSGRAFSDSGTGNEEGEVSKRHLVDPTPELSDNTPIENIRFSTHTKRAGGAGLKTVGEVRETADKTLLTFQGVGLDSVTQLQKTLGLPSTDGVRTRYHRLGCSAAIAICLAIAAQQAQPLQRGALAISGDTTMATMRSGRARRGGPPRKDGPGRTRDRRKKSD